MGTDTYSSPRQPDREKRTQLQQVRKRGVEIGGELERVVGVRVDHRGIGAHLLLGRRTGRQEIEHAAHRFAHHLPQFFHRMRRQPAGQCQVAYASTAQQRLPKAEGGVV